MISIHKRSKKVLCAAIIFLIMLSGCAKQSVTIITRHTLNPWEPDIGYAEVVEANGTVYISGVVCGGESYAEAVPKCYKELQHVLAEVKLKPQNIIKETVFTKDIEAFKEQIPVRKAFYGNKEYPAATWIEANRFYLPEHLIEVEVIAVRTE